MEFVFNIICAFIRCQLALIAPNGKRHLVAEMLVLKAQLLLMQRKQTRAPSLTKWHRLFFAAVSAWIPMRRLARCSVILRPATIISLHRWLVGKKYSKLFGQTGRRGRKPIAKEVRELIIAIRANNPMFGCPQIAALVTDRIGIPVSDETVRRILAKHRPGTKGDGPSWLAFIGAQADSLWSIDLFRAESILLKSHWVLVVMDQYSRKIIGFATVKGPASGVDLCVMFNRILGSLKPPKHLSHDNDPLFKFERWIANMSIFRIDEIASVPGVPWSHPFVERLIGTVRREFIDRTLFWNQVDLERKLSAYQQYFNSSRVHQGIEGRRPSAKYSDTESVTTNADHLQWRSHCNGLFVMPEVA
jgi:transposase InsO family protein